MKTTKTPTIRLRKATEPRKMTDIGPVGRYLLGSGCAPTAAAYEMAQNRLDAGLAMHIARTTSKKGGR